MRLSLPVQHNQHSNFKSFIKAGFELLKLYLQRCWSHGTSFQMLGGSLQMTAGPEGSTASLVVRQTKRCVTKRRYCI